MSAKVLPVFKKVGGKEKSIGKPGSFYVYGQELL